MSDNITNKSKLKEFELVIPKNLIAKYPADPRTSSQMLVLNKNNGDMVYRDFTDILSYLKRGDCIVLNEARVFPSLIIGIKEKSNARISVLLLRKLNIKVNINDPNSEIAEVL